MDNGRVISGDEGLSSVIDEFEKDISSAFRNRPHLLPWLFLLALVLMASPVAVFWLNENTGTHWSEVVKNVSESIAVLAAVFGLFKWLDERRNRATDVLLKLEDNFKIDKVMQGRKMVEARDHDSPSGSDELDTVLRFYVVLYGIYRAKQVPAVSLSICFRYWLAHYFRNDRPQFRIYIDSNYPTLSHWLREDCRHGLHFFRPRQLFPNSIDDQLIIDIQKGQRA